MALHGDGMTYTCRCKCANFREHALGVSFAGSAMPSRSNIKALEATEKRWEADGDALVRLTKEGHSIPRLDGAAELEKNATQPIELKHGRLYGDKADAMQHMSDATGL